MNLFIIHSYNADTKESFGPYIEEEAKKLGIDVIFPDFPIRSEASYDKWSKIMNKYLESGELNSTSIVITHSLGAYFIPKYLAEKNVCIGLYISCAGSTKYIGDREDLRKTIEDFSPSDEQYEKAIDLMANRYCIYSNNDHVNPQSELEYYADMLKANKVFIPNIGHMGKTSNVKELPDAIHIIEKYIEKQ